MPWSHIPYTYNALYNTVNTSIWFLTTVALLWAKCSQFQLFHVNTIIFFFSCFSPKIYRYAVYLTREDNTIILHNDTGTRTVLLCTAPSSRMQVPADGRASISHRKHRVCAAKTAHTRRNLIPLPNHKISLWIFVFLCIVPSPGINVYLFYLLTYNY